ncbi:hypothetical protein [Verminephrobacter aporrectodeae]|uniref:hypothetical protein n=1 Tax=Verminephrobacter aporrectodeae TaxID=1110389 RepID=UPI002244E6F3|nr:hypothetical protein [Verminephrobacter aporrectodeae]
MKKTLISMVLLLGALLSACGDGTQPQQSDSASRPAPEPASVKKSQLQDVKPAEVVSLSLKDLGLPADADEVTPSGAVSEALIQDGQLRFVTPDDIGENQEAEFEIRSGATTSVFHVVIRSQRPTSAFNFGDGPADAPPLPKLIVEGLAPGNVVTGAPLTFRMQGISGMNLKDNSHGYITAGDNNDIALILDDLWSFNLADSSFSISGPAMQRMLDTLPIGDFFMTLNLSRDSEFGVVYDIRATKAEAKLSGRLLSEQGAPVTSLAGRKVLLEGVNTRMRAVAVLDANGGFALERHVLPDIYFLTLSDLHYPNVIRTSFPVYEGSTQAQVTMVVPPGLGVDTGANTAKQRAAPGSSAVQSSVTQDGKGPPPRSIPTAKRALAPTPLAAEGVDSAVFSATAAEQDRLVNKKIDFQVPIGTESVGIRITVFSEEEYLLPKVSSRAELEQLIRKHQQSGMLPREDRKYKDTWSYSVVGFPDIEFSASGLAKQLRFTDGGMTETRCVDVTGQTKNAALNISGSVSAINIGDDLLPTTTTVELTLGCKKLKSSSSTLEVLSAQFSSPNKNANPIISPITIGDGMHGNLAGCYLSIPQSGSDNTHTIPLKITYSPADAEITEMNLGITELKSGEPFGIPTNFSTVNLLTQNHTKQPGLITFPGISLPAFAGDMALGNLAVMVRLKGSVGGAAVSSDPAGRGGRVKFGVKNEFTPLYLAGDVAKLSGRRFGPRDDGGDSWATRGTIKWLLENDLQYSGHRYRFNDISSQHVAQTRDGRSIMDHAGHSDGRQIDMRYADGQGGYSDALGGQGNGEHIKQLINAAAAEVKKTTKKPGSWYYGPKLEALQHWITENRTMLEIEADSRSTRAVYIGQSFIEDVLVHGKFPSNSVTGSIAIPLVSAWTEKSAKISSQPYHMNHWHISLSNYGPVIN